MKLLRSLQAPLLFLGVSALAFGVQIPWLGFYLDDWIILQAYHMRGISGLFAYAFDDDRPLVFWTWALSLKMFGSAPLGLQLWALVWRWLSVVVLWAGWRRLWPQHTRQVTLAALLFAIYPLFTQQSASLAYGFHWICLFFYGLSLLWMLLSIEPGRRYGGWSAGALLASGLQLFTSEYFLGLELLRPLVIWLALGAYLPDRRARLLKTLQIWLPYGLVLGGFALWRFHFMPVSGQDRNAPQLLIELLRQPLNGLVGFAETIAQDMAELFMGSWYRTFQPGLFTVRPMANMLAWAAMLLTSGGLAAYFLLGRSRFQPDQTQAGWYRSAIPFGMAALLLGMLPGWAIGRQIFDPTGAFNDRFGLAAMFGAALVLVGLLEMLFKKERYWVLLVCILVGLGVGHHFRAATNYRWSWEKQRQLYWQLKWRAPDLPEPTAVLSDGPLVGYMGSWANTSALLQMYAPFDPSFDASYWYFDLQKIDVVSNVQEDGVLNDARKFLRYAAPVDDSLVIQFKPEAGQCLWALSSRDQDNAYIGQSLRDVLKLSDRSRIQDEPQAALRSDIFGSEIPRNWCYYFQKADLASDQFDWPGVLSLWQQAQDQGLHPRVGVEYRPFIEAAAHNADWALAYDFSKQALYPKNDMLAYVCRTWQRVAVETGDSPEKTETLQRIRNDFGCTGNLSP